MISLPMTVLEHLTFRVLGKASGSTILVAQVPWLEGRAIGVDPGRNYAVAQIVDGCVSIRYGKFEECKTQYEYALSAYREIHELYGGAAKDAVVRVEGSSYKEPYGQTGLAYIRAGFYLGFLATGFLDCKITPPAVPRKAVLGKGSMSMLEVLPSLNHNAADALCLALYAGGYKFTEET